MTEPRKQLMTPELKAEIAEIERAAKERFEAAGQRLFGVAFKARHPKLG